MSFKIQIGLVPVNITHNLFRELTYAQLPLSPFLLMSAMPLSIVEHTSSTWKVKMLREPLEVFFISGVGNMRPAKHLNVAREHFLSCLNMYLGWQWTTKNPFYLKS